MTQQDGWRELYPFPSEYYELNGSGHRLHYIDQRPAAAEHGESAAADCLLMVHGNPTWSFYWRQVVTRFAPRIRCIAPDHLGMGLSDKPADFEYGLQRHIDHLCEWVEHLDLQRIALLVHDWGGAIGLGMATAMPDRISRLLITNTAAFPPPYIPWRIRVCRWPVIGPWLMNSLNVFPRMAVRMATTQPGGLKRNVAQGLMAPYADPAHRVGVFHFVNDIPAGPGHPTWKVLEGLESNLARLRSKPVDIIWGERDWCFRPALIERLASHFDSVQVTSIASAGHYLAEDAPQQLGDVIERALFDSRSQ